MRAQRYHLDYYAEQKEGRAVSETMKWPYPIRYGVVNEVDADLLVLGGGMGGPMAAITAAKMGLTVVLVDKGSTKYSGAAGSGFDHWLACPNPASKITAEELTQVQILGQGGYSNGISHYIKAKEGYDCLLEMESYGAKVRDTNDVFKGADFRDEETKLLFARDYENRAQLRMWGRTFKPALYRELKRSGVKLYERIMATSLLTDGGKQGSKVVGATGFNVRTGEFYVFRAKATLLCMGHPGGRGWVFTTEWQGMGNFYPGNSTGEAYSLTWNAGAELTMMEKTQLLRRQRASTEGGYQTSWVPATVVDSEGKEVPYVDRDGKILKTYLDRCLPASGQRIIMPPGGPAFFHAPAIYYEYRGPGPIPDLAKRVEKGEFKQPLYVDFPGMPPHERRVIYGMMIGQEGRTWLAYHNMTRAGFNPEKHQLQIYDEPPQGGGFGWRYIRGGGLMVDWRLRTNLEGLYAAGDAIFDGVGVSHAIATGRYAARQVARYLTKASDPQIDQNQVNAEMERVYTPIRRDLGIEWKEVDSVRAKVMQHYCGDTRNDERLKIGLKWFDELEAGEAQNICARNPHELMRSLEVLSMITWNKVVMHQSMARKSSNPWLNFVRTDYLEIDPPEWHKWVTIKQQDGDVKVGELPIDYWGDLVENYEKYAVS